MPSNLCACAAVKGQCQNLPFPGSDICGACMYDKHGAHI